ncbi:hypothetical protein GCM10017602_16740 [Herbiconiux flava]|nr:hypothetical protein [Herbiconiux flava]GLK17192.1 hypothetical protein GCM10017602_16740 [Herbiconiux flava]
MQQARLSPAEVAAAAGMNRSTVSRRLLEGADMPIADVFRIALACGVDPVEMFAESGRVETGASSGAQAQTNRLAAFVRTIVREELLRSDNAKIAYSIPEAADAAGLSTTSIRNAIARNDLVPSFYGPKPLLPRAELERWLVAMPSEPPRR